MSNTDTTTKSVVNQGDFIRNLHMQSNIVRVL